MAFQPGNTYGKGRKTGSRNLRSLEWETFGRDMLASGLPRVLEELDKVKGKEFLFFFDRFLNYFKPKNSSIELIERTAATEEELDQKIRELYSKVYGNEN